MSAVLPLYFTASELAALVQVDDKTVYRWAQQEPSMPVLRIKGVVRFPRDRVLRWLAAHEQGQCRPRRTKPASVDPHINSQRAESHKSASPEDAA